jgi:hypothetical protein
MAKNGAIPDIPKAQVTAARLCKGFVKRADYTAFRIRQI